jgi:putative sigma-54 modulation protein
MEIHFTGRNVEVTDALKTFTTEKMAKLTQRGNVETLHITFEVKKTTQIAEATLHLNRTDIHASAAADDMYAAIDLLVDKLIEQLTKHKEKVSDHHRE